MMSTEPRHEQQAERQRVAGDDPLQIGIEGKLYRRIVQWIGMVDSEQAARKDVGKNVVREEGGLKEQGETKKRSTGEKQQQPGAWHKVQRIAMAISVPDNQGVGCKESKQDERQKRLVKPRQSDQAVI